MPYFYSRPCGRGDIGIHEEPDYTNIFLLTPLREGRLVCVDLFNGYPLISTHAPAGGATLRSTQALLL